MTISQKKTGWKKVQIYPQNLKIHRFDEHLKLMMYKLLGYDTFSKKNVNYELMVEKSENLPQNLKIQRFDEHLKLMMYNFLGYDNFSKKN